MSDPVLATDRPHILGWDITARLVHPNDMTGIDWRGAELLLVDVTAIELLEATYGRRDAPLLLIGYGDADEQACAALVAAGRAVGYARVDAFDSHTALLAILGHYRSGDRARLLGYLRGH